MHIKNKPLLLLGAGASIDCGLQSAFGLTRAIYDILRSNQYVIPSQVFGYIIAKILLRKVKLGGTPYDDINVEEAYDAVFRLVNRDTDVVSEFVNGWDPFLSSMSPGFNANRFSNHLKRSLEVRSRSLGNGASVTFDSHELRQAALEIERGNSGNISHILSQALSYLLNALRTCLAHNPKRIDYMKQLLSFIVEMGGAVASLNYDLVVESALTEVGLRYDYGLTMWNEQKLVKFDTSSGVKLIKLHGSMNWFGDYDHIVFDAEKRQQRQPLMIFGDNNRKLEPRGPFLQLRHDFERQLLRSNTLIVIGYSFGDNYLNALIRRWTSTRSRAKLIVVDPSPRLFTDEVIGKTYRTDAQNNILRKIVDITHIQKNAAVAIDDVIFTSKAKGSWNIPEGISGLIPQILINRIVA